MTNEYQRNNSRYYHKSVRPLEMGSTLHQPLKQNVKDGGLYLWPCYSTDPLLNYLCIPLTLIEIEGAVVDIYTLPHPYLHHCSSFAVGLSKSGLEENDL